MDIISDVITCISCKEKLKVPVILPCGHTICKLHVDKAVTNERRTIDCLICKKTHEIPSDGFVPNIALKRLLEVNNHNIDRVDENISALHKFEWMLDEFKKIKTEPEMRIHTVLSDFRNTIDLRRKEMKLEIDKEALNAIEQINVYENDCKESINLDSSLDIKIDKWENELKESRLILSKLKRNSKEWNEISNKTACHLKELQSEFIKLNQDLFLSQIQDFMFYPFFDMNQFHIIR